MAEKLRTDVHVPVEAQLTRLEKRIVLVPVKSSVASDPAEMMKVQDVFAWDARFTWLPAKHPRLANARPHPQSIQIVFDDSGKILHTDRTL